MSVRWSRPTIRAVYLLLSCSVTSTLAASPTTWLLVTIVPEASMIKPEPSAMRFAAPSPSPRLPPKGPPPNDRGICWPWPPCWSKKRRRKSSNGAPPNSSGDCPDSCSASDLPVTEIFTTAGNTRLTNGAKLCCGMAMLGEGVVVVSAGGFCAHTRGDKARVAPSPKPRAAARVFLNRGGRTGSAGSCVINDLLLRGASDQGARRAERLAGKMARQGDSPLSGGLIRRNLADGAVHGGSGTAWL